MQYPNYLEAYSDDYFATVYDYHTDVQILFIRLEWAMGIHLYLRDHHNDELYFMKETEQIGDFIKNGNTFLTKMNNSIFEELITDILHLKGVDNQRFLELFVEKAGIAHRKTKELIPVWIGEHLQKAIDGEKNSKTDESSYNPK